MVHKSEVATARVVTEEDWNTTATLEKTPYPLGKYLSEKEVRDRTEYIFFLVWRFF